MIHELNRTEEVIKLRLPQWRDWIEEVKSFMYAIIATGGKQYRVKEGDEILVEKLNAAEGDAVVFDQVLAAGEGADIKVGSPVIAGAAVNAKVVENGKGPKVITFKYRAKKDYRNKKGHRQPFTKVVIESISL